MARPRKNDPRPLLKPIIEEFAAMLSDAVERSTFERVLGAVAGAGGSLQRAPRRRAVTRCYYPGCSNVAAPRFGMFCAALHKNLSRAEKERYRSQRASRSPQARGSSSPRSARLADKRHAAGG
jgi:hypothetical protein